MVSDSFGKNNYLFASKKQTIIKSTTSETVTVYNIPSTL